MTIDLDTLESAAKAATPGPWEDMGNHPDHLHGAVNKGNKHIALCNHYESAEPTKTVTAEEMRANAAYIAVANPATVLELVAELRAKSAMLEEIFDDCWVKDSGVCPVCHTYTHWQWCWYPKLAKMLGKPLDENDKRFLAEEKK